MTMTSEEPATVIEGLGMQVLTPDVEVGSDAWCRLRVTQLDNLETMLGNVRHALHGYGDACRTNEQREEAFHLWVTTLKEEAQAILTPAPDDEWWAEGEANAA